MPPLDTLRPLYGRHVGLQEVLDLLDLTCTRKDLEQKFRPQVRTALDFLIVGAPDGCVDAIMEVAAQIIESGGQDSNGKLPTGMGGGLVLHFHLRNKQIGQFVGDEVMPMLSRFALIKLAALACMRNNWISETKPFEKSMASYKARVNEVAVVAARECHETERWKSTLVKFLRGPLMLTLVRDFAFTFVWAGYLIPGRKKTVDLVIARHVREGREQFNRFKQDGLRTLSAMRVYGLGDYRREEQP